MAKNQTYSQLTAQLKEIIDWFENEDVDLDEAVKKYEQANKLIGKLEDYLKSAENQIRKVTTK